MSEMNCVSRRPRCGMGRFLSSPSSSRSRESLANQRMRQKAYIMRRSRVRKRVVLSFAKAFIIKTKEKQHWLPGDEKDGLLLNFFDSIIQDSYRESTRFTRKQLKSIYFKGDPSKSGRRLPRIRVSDADQSDSNTIQVSAFVGWRFPFPVDSVEMDDVKKWLKDHENMLKVSIREATDICFRIFSSYKKGSNRYLYSGYPPAALTTETTPVQSGSIETNSNAAVVGTEEGRGGQPEQLGEEPHTEKTIAEELVYVQEVMAVAKRDVFYRALKLALTPSCPSRLDFMCTAWLSTFEDGKPPEKWSGVEKDIFEYCRLTSSGDKNSSRYRQLHFELTDNFEVFRLIRSSAGLPIYNEDNAPLEEIE